MPQVPYNQQRLTVEPLNAPRARPIQYDTTSPLIQSAQSIQRGVDQLTSVYQEIQSAADAAEAGRLKRETSADLQALVKESATKYSNPDEFEQVTKEGIEQIRTQRLESASNERVRAILRNNIGDDVRLRIADVQVIKHGKLRDKAAGDWATMKLESLQQYATEENVLERSRIMSDLGRTLNQLSQTNLMDADVRARELSDLQERVAEVDIKRDFKDKPIETLEKLDKGEYFKKYNIDPRRLDQLRDHLSVAYRTAQEALRRKVSLEQDEAFADAMVQARQGKLSMAEIDRLSSRDANGTRAIDAQQARTLADQVQATAASGGVTYSNPSILSDMQYRLHRGKITPEEIRSQQINGQLTIRDANELYNAYEARVRRDRAEAREDRTASRLNDVGNHPSYKIAEDYIRRALPNTDRLDLDHSFRVMAGQAFVDFDRLARSVDKEGRPLYRPDQLMDVANNLVDGTLLKMGLTQNAARAKLLPGIQTPQDVADAVRAKRITESQAVEQMRYLQQLQVGVGAPPSTKTTTPQSRDAAAKERAKAQAQGGYQHP